MNAKEALEKSKDSVRNKVEEAVENAVKKGFTSAMVDVAISKKFAEELSENGYDVLVFDCPGWSKSTEIDFSENATGKVVFTDDPDKAGRRLTI